MQCCSGAAVKQMGTLKTIYWDVSVRIKQDRLRFLVPAFRHVLKPETTKQNGRNETTEMTKTKPPEQPKKAKRPKRAKINKKVKKLRP